MKRNNKAICAVLAAILLAMTAIGCEVIGEASLETAAEKTEALHVAALKGPTGMGLAYVIAEDEQDTVELFDAPDVVASKFISGEIDVAAVPVNLASVLYKKTEGDTVVLAVNTLGVLYVLDGGDTIHEIGDLSGKTVYATGQGSTPEYILNYLLTKNGLEDVNVEYVGEHATLAAMAAGGEAEIAMLPEPQVSAATVKNDTLRIALNLTEEWEKVSETKLVQGVYVARKANYEQKKQAIEAFMEKIASSVERVNTESNAADIVAQAGIVPNAAIAARAIPRANIVCIRGEEMQAAVSAMLEVLFEAQPSSVGGTLPGEDFYAG